MYIVHQNIPGCLPEGESSVFDTLAQAKSYMRDLVWDFECGWNTYVEAGINPPIIHTPLRDILARDIKGYGLDIAYASFVHSGVVINIGHITSEDALEYGLLESVYDD